MGTQHVQVIRRTTYDLGGLTPESTQSPVLRRSAPATAFQKRHVHGQRARWWRADLGHGLDDGAAVSCWGNQGVAGIGGDATQTTASDQPACVESHASFDGQAALDFDGGDLLATAAGTWWEQTKDGQSLTVVGIVHVTDPSSSTQNIIFRTYRPDRAMVRGPAEPDGGRRREGA